MNTIRLEINVKLFVNLYKQSSKLRNQIVFQLKRNID